MVKMIRIILFLASFLATTQTLAQSVSFGNQKTVFSELSLHLTEQVTTEPFIQQPGIDLAFWWQISPQFHIALKATYEQYDIEYLDETQNYQDTYAGLSLRILPFGSVLYLEGSARYLFRIHDHVHFQDWSFGGGGGVLLKLEWGGYVAIGYNFFSLLELERNQNVVYIGGVAPLF